MVLAYASLIFFLSSLPGKVIPTVRISDKVVHAIEFGGLTLLLCRALRAQVPTRSPHYVALVSILATIGYALGDEAHQLFTPQRTADMADVTADSLGTLLTAWGWLKGGERWPWMQ
jgi:VanZ family protein